MSEISILLIEDHDLTRMGLKTELQSHSGFKVIGEAANATQGLKLLETIKPNVAVIDIGLPDMSGIELTRKFRRYQTETGQFQTKILILTMNNTEDAVLAAFAAGADSYYMKETSINKFTEAVEATFHGNSWIDPAIASVVLRKMRQGVPGDHQSLEKPKTVKIEALEIEYEQVLETYPLTQRELEILELIVGGCSNGQIAEKLYITVGTVKTHVRNILNKLCVDDRTQAAVRALRSGLVSSIMSEISILLIEAHDLTRMGLKTKLQLHGGFKVIGEAANATQGLNLLVTMKPNVAVIDIGLPGMDGIELTRKFRRYQAETGQSQTRILILTMNNTEDAVLAAFAAGADSYYMKDTRFNKFIEAVQATANGNFWIDPAIASVVLRKMRQGVPGDHQSLDKPKTYLLTQRELEILELIVGGCSNGQIAEKLYITVGTVKTHVRNILNKLCADDSL